MTQVIPITAASATTAADSQVAGRPRWACRRGCWRKTPEIIEQFNRRRIAERSIFFEAAIDDLCEGFGDVGPKLLQRRRLIVHERVHRRPLGLAVERPPSGEELVQHDAEREHIGPRIAGWPSACSGDMYPLLPRIAPAWV